MGQYDIRGQEVSILFAVGGVSQIGSMLKVKNFTVTERGELVESDYVGEPVSDLDYRHDGWDMSWEIDVRDSIAMDFLTNIVARDDVGIPQPDITITVIYKFREGAGVEPRMEVYYGTVMRPSETGFSGRKEYISTSWEAKAKRRRVIAL